MLVPPLLQMANIVEVISVAMSVNICYFSAHWQSPWHFMHHSPSAKGVRVFPCGLTHVYFSLPLPTISGKPQGALSWL